MASRHGLARACVAAALVSGFLLGTGAGADAAGGAGHAASRSAAATPLDDTGPFVDTFAGASDTDPLYGLNDALDSREIGAVHAGYTRVSGMWNGAAPPPPRYVQVNNPQYANRLLFTTGISAIMLDAPVRADTTGHYGILTTVDPVVGDTKSPDWASLVLSRSHTSAGYVTNADVDLGLTVRSTGSVTLYSHGQQFFTGDVPAAVDGYVVSVRVSTGADRLVSVEVNNSTFDVTAPSTVNRWPSEPYLYLGSYLTGSEVTTFGPGQPYQGLQVSNVDGSVAGSARPFVDTFDGSTDTDPSGYGLDNGLSARQPSVVSSGYTRTSGLWNSSKPPAAWYSQVNHPAYPDRLSFWTGPSSVRLNNPVSADLGGGYTVSATVDPVANGGDTDALDWVSLMLSGSRSADGYPTNTDSDLGLTIRSAGQVQVYRKGVPTWATEPVVSPNPSGTFDVSVSVPDVRTGSVDVTVNGTTLTVPGPPLPATAYLSLGAYITGAEVSTVDDLRVSQLAGLSYYGYFGLRWPPDNVDHTPTVAGYTNLNLDDADWQESSAGFLDYCRPHTCMELVQGEQFDQAGGRMVLSGDRATRMAKLTSLLAPDLDKIGAIYMVDEPYGRGVSAADLQTATDELRAAFPDQLLVLNLDGTSVTANHDAIPAQIDLVGFDWYCKPEATLRSTLSALEVRLTPFQRTFLVPEAAAGKAWCPGGTTDAVIAARQSVYRSIAASDPRVTYLMNFGWWLGSYQENGQYAGDLDPLHDLPQTAAAQRSIGQSILGAG